MADGLREEMEQILARVAADFVMHNVPNNEDDTFTLVIVWLNTSNEGQQEFRISFEHGSSITYEEFPKETLLNIAKHYLNKNLLAFGFAKLVKISEYAPNSQQEDDDDGVISYLVFANQMAGMSVFQTRCEIQDSGIVRRLGDYQGSKFEMEHFFLSDLPLTLFDLIS